MSFNSKLINLLKTNPNLIDDEGELLISAVQDRAWKIDHNLIKLLLSDDEIKGKFFDEIEGHWVFNINTFLEFISQKNFLDNSYTRFRNRIGLTIGGKYLSERGEVALSFPYKDCVLEGGQTKEEEKHNEIFFNEVLAQDEINRMFDPKVLTNFSRYTNAGEQPVKEINRDENGVIRENLVIKGNNLIALNTLKQQFLGKVKLIYIDPPYNTGGSTDTFSYNNNFKHSTWLTFIKNRLEVSKDLLREDGFIAITIDHVELFYLGLITDEIFGRENRVGIVTILINPKGRQHERFFSSVTEYMLVYAKNISIGEFNKVALDEDKIKSFDQQDENGRFRWELFIRARSSTLRKNKPNSWYPLYVSKDLKEVTHIKKEGYIEVLPTKNNKEFTWKTQLSTFIERNINGFFRAANDVNGILIYHKYYEQQVLKNLWTKKKYFPEFQGTNLLKKLLGKNIFSYPKSLYAVKDTLKIMTSKNDIILDFFSGSGTTAHAVFDLNKDDEGNRKFIIIEQLDYIYDVTIKRLQKVIEFHDKGNFIYCELMKYNQAFLDRIQSAQDTEELIQIWREMAQRSFLNWYVNPEMPEEAVNDFIAIGEEENGFKKQKKLLAELLDKNQLYVNLSEINDKQFKVSEEDKLLNKSFFGGTNHD